MAQQDELDRVDREFVGAEDIRAALDRLESQSEITREDLEEFRQALPAEPVLAKAVQLWLPFPWDQTFEYVSASEHQAAYWRTKPDRAVESEAQQRRDELVRESADVMTGTRGTVRRGGKEIPASAAVLAETMEGRRFPGSRVARSGRRALARLRRVLGLDGGDGGDGGEGE